jgi:opacity protein-like surface antigen
MRPASLGMTIFAAISLLASPLAAQVGYPPSTSPYRDIQKGHTITPMAGYFFGDGGQFNVGPHDGPVYGARYDLRSSRAIGVGLGVFYGDLQRFIVNPSLTNPRSGPVSQSVTFIELDMQLNPTGGKSWHRIAPFLGLGTGLGISSSTPADTSRFDFGNKFYFVPSGGFRLFLSQRLHLRAEGKATFWKITYPTTFRIEQSGTTFTEWSTSWWVMGGLGYSISP